jgi:hypothetical protein
MVKNACLSLLQRCGGRLFSGTGNKVNGIFFPGLGVASMVSFKSKLGCGMRILDLRYSVYFKWTERSDTANPKSEIKNPKFCGI